MLSPHLNAVVRLTEDVPTRRLRCGDEGIVVSVWLSPGDFYFEVEFHESAGSRAVRALLHAEQLEVVASQPPKLATE
jgi:hypothetical protein